DVFDDTVEAPGLQHDRGYAEIGEPIRIFSLVDLGVEQYEVGFECDDGLKVYGNGIESFQRVHFGRIVVSRRHRDQASASACGIDHFGDVRGERNDPVDAVGEGDRSTDVVGYRSMPRARSAAGGRHDDEADENAMYRIRKDRVDSRAHLQKVRTAQVA